MLNQFSFSGSTTPSTPAAPTESSSPKEAAPVVTPSPAQTAAAIPVQTAITAQQDTAAMQIVFPKTGLIDPNEQVEKLRQIALAMSEEDRRRFPDKIRDAILKHHAEPDTHPAVSDHDMCLAIFIQRMSDSPLTDEQLQVKANAGKKPTKAQTAASTLADLMALGKGQ